MEKRSKRRHAARNNTLLLCKLQHLHFAITIAGEEARRARTSSRRQEATMVHLPGVIIDASFNGAGHAACRFKSIIGSPIYMRPIHTSFCTTKTS
jgi:hypothetical protein